MHFCDPWPLLLSAYALQKKWRKQFIWFSPLKDTFMLMTNTADGPDIRGLRFTGEGAMHVPVFVMATVLCNFRAAWGISPCPQWGDLDTSESATPDDHPRLSSGGDAQQQCRLSCHLVPDLYIYSVISLTSEVPQWPGAPALLQSPSCPQFTPETTQGLPQPGLRFMAHVQGDDLRGQDCPWKSRDNRPCSW